MKTGKDFQQGRQSFFGRHWFGFALAGLFVAAILRAGLKAEATERKTRPARPTEAPVAQPSGQIHYTENLGSQPGERRDEMKIIQKSGGEVVANFDEAAAMAFLKRFAPVALGEQRKFDIPASVILAAALVESQAGQCAPAREANNFFLLPDGSPAQSGVFFDKNGQKWARFKTPWDSFRANSLYIEQRFSGLKKSAGGDWRAWLEGLARGGYSPVPGFEQMAKQAVGQFQLEEIDQNKF